MKKKKTSFNSTLNHCKRRKKKEVNSLKFNFYFNLILKVLKQTTNCCNNLTILFSFVFNLGKLMLTIKKNFALTVVNE